MSSSFFIEEEPIKLLPQEFIPNPDIYPNMKFSSFEEMMAVCVDLDAAAEKASQEGRTFTKYKCELKHEP